MGFKVSMTSYKLVFDDPKFDGLIVQVRRGSIAEREAFFDITENDDLFDFFAKLTVKWNAEDDDGVTLPLTRDGMKMLEEETFQAIQGAWLRAVRHVPAPLEQPSSDGAQSLEASLPMEPVSPSLAS